MGNAQRFPYLHAPFPSARWLAAPVACSPATNAAVPCCSALSILRHHLGLLQRIEDLAIQAFISQLAVEAFTVPVLPGTARLDVQRLRAHRRQPLPQSSAMNSGPLSERMCSGIPCTSITSASVSIRSNCSTAVPPASPDTSACTRQSGSAAAASSIVRHGAHKIVAPDVILLLRSQPHTGAIAQPQPPSRPLFLRHLQPFASPDPLHPVLPHRPPRVPQQCRDPPIAVPPILRRQARIACVSSIFIRAPQRQIALRPSPLPQHPARPPLTTSYCSRACSTAHRRRSGLRSFPPQYPLRSACPTTAPSPAVATCRSLSPVLSAVAPGPSSVRRTLSASGSTSVG